MSHKTEVLPRTMGDDDAEQASDTEAFLGGWDRHNQPGVEDNGIVPEARADLEGRFGGPVVPWIEKGREERLRDGTTVKIRPGPAPSRRQ